MRIKAKDLNVKEMEPTEKDRLRAEGLRWNRNSFHGDNSPFRSKASAMSKLIKKPDKMVRRAMAVAELYGTNDYFRDTVPPGHYWDPEWKAEKDAWTPFADSLFDMGFTRAQVRWIAFRREG